MELGILKTVAARIKWQSEARDFTPWLATNIHALNEAIGLELEVENMEVRCGPYAADILAKDTGTDKYVIIENQLEKTNHDHLGKAITYASVLDASTIIWIATDFTEEHKKALDWLNDHTSDEISIFGVQVELWQIDQSNPALRFNVISRPNQAVRQAARSKSSDELSENRKFQFDFWNRFKDKLAQTKKIPSLQTPRPQYWFDISLGKSYIHISNTCNTDVNTVGVRVYISNKIADTMLPYLESKKEEIEASIGHVLDWNPNPMNRDKVIVLLHPTDFSDPQKVNEALDWLVTYSIKFRDTFSKLVRQIPL
ncbi:DUF4268 domain-containing protein [Algoriphagus sp. NG3]|uniref:DUF4268 domain-containing protein n=1 Tax=Algoriphagus sp. NG3 TaxID=3097546 RepID=UPI002A81F01A|nr:DUF4268 domain-containing protein [Algoriphagus sp. NG3]WPR77705.1 DUF4268 domain-containing protein [Algoriphagus sp. NG3]